MDGRQFLSNDILMEILLRLTVKSLLRFMVVSKNWKSLISHSYFKKLHHQRFFNNYQNPPSMLVYHFYDEDHVLSTFNQAGEVVQQWSLPYLNGQEMMPFPPESKLVCFTNIYRSYLCNPSTRRLFNLPDSSFNGYFGGFSYDPSNDEYMILKSDFNDLCEVLTFSISNEDEQLNYNAWRPVKAVMIRRAIYYPWGVFLFGAMYWITYDDDGIYLLSFNTKNEVFSTVRMQPDLQYYPDIYMSLLEIKGELYFMSVLLWSNTLKLWKLSDVKNQVWTQSFTNCWTSLEYNDYSNSLEFNAKVLIYRLKHLQDHEELDKILRDFWKLRIGKRIVGYPLGKGIHTNLFSL